MKIIVKETGKTEVLSIIDPKTGCDYTEDFIGNAGGLDQFTLNEKRDAYLTDQENYNWWKRVIEDNQALEDRIYALKAKQGSVVFWVVVDNATVDLEDHAQHINAALDEAFGA